MARALARLHRDAARVARAAHRRARGGGPPDLEARAKPLDSTVFLADEPRYRPNWSVYRYDPARARRLFEQAGCRRGADGVYSCAGQRLRLRFFTTAGSVGRELALQLMRTQLRSEGRARRSRAAALPGVIGVALKKTIRGFIPGGNRFNFFENTEDWWVERAR